MIHIQRYKSMSGYWVRMSHEDLFSLGIAKQVGISDDSDTRIALRYVYLDAADAQIAEDVAFQKGLVLTEDQPLIETRISAIERMSFYHPGYLLRRYYSGLVVETFNGEQLRLGVVKNDGKVGNNYCLFLNDLNDPDLDDGDVLNSSHIFKYIAPAKNEEMMANFELFEKTNHYEPIAIDFSEFVGSQALFYKSVTGSHVYVEGSTLIN